MIIWYFSKLKKSHQTFCSVGHYCHFRCCFCPTPRFITCLWFRQFKAESKNKLHDDLFFFFVLISYLSGITHEEMVQESKRHWHRLEQNAQRQKVRLWQRTPLCCLTNAHHCWNLVLSFDCFLLVQVGFTKQIFLSSPPSSAHARATPAQREQQ